MNKLMNDSLSNEMLLMLKEVLQLFEDDFEEDYK